jgi:hypothetical protein
MLCRSRLRPSLGFAAIAGTPRIENGGTFAVDFADAQGYSGFGLKPQTPTSKSAQLASRAPARAELGTLPVNGHPECSPMEFHSIVVHTPKLKDKIYNQGKSRDWIQQRNLSTLYEVRPSIPTRSFLCLARSTTI